MDILKMVSNDSNVSGKLKNIMKEKPMSKDKVKIIEEETEWCFNFRGMCLGVMAVSKESAYGFMYSEYDSVSKEELDDAYEGGNH